MPWVLGVVLEKVGQSHFDLQADNEAVRAKIAIPTIIIFLLFIIYFSTS